MYFIAEHTFIAAESEHLVDVSSAGEIGSVSREIMLKEETFPIVDLDYSD